MSTQDADTNSGNSLIVHENIIYDYIITHNVTRDWSMGFSHFHDVFEIMYTLSDGVKFFVNDMIYELNRGDLFLFNDTDIHRPLPEKGLVYERFLIHFKPEYIKLYSTEKTELLENFLVRKGGNINIVHIPEKLQDEFGELLSIAALYQKSKEYGSDVYRKITLCEILLFINNICRMGIRGSKSSNNHEDFNKYSKINKLIQSLIQYIRDHLNENLNLDLLSEKFFVSKYHLGRIFKQATGFTITEYIIIQRIMCAKKLLKEQVSIQSACKMTGFNNVSHFIRTFKAHVGMTPKKYSKSAL